MSPRAPRIERALQLLRDIEITRLTGDRFQGGLVEAALDELDAEGGYQRVVRAGHNRIPGFGESQYGRRPALAASRIPR